MKKVLIIGKRGFLGNSLSKYLKKFYYVRHISFKQLNEIKNKLNRFNYIVNTSTNKSYIFKRYNEKFDNDLKIAKLINNNKTIYIFLSTRKVYKCKINLNEKSKLSPKSNYSKNKLISEKKLNKILGKKLLILRISNIIGDRKSTKKIHHTFIDVFFENIKKGFVFDNGDDFKDFLSIDKFCQIFRGILKKDLVGVYNVSIGQKVYLNNIIEWLNRYNKNKLKKIKIIKKKNDSFFLNNKKLMSKIKIKNSLTELKNYCHKLSKKKFS